METLERVFKRIGVKDVSCLPRQVKIIEVSTRDGLQSKDVIVPTERKSRSSIFCPKAVSVVSRPLRSSGLM